MWRLWVSALVAFVTDQVSKIYVFDTLDLATKEVIDVLPPLLVLRKGMNTGVNFGLFSDSSDAHRWMLIGLSMLLCGLLWFWARRSFHRSVEFVAAGLVIGGALGNVADRIVLTGVRDFLNMSCCWIENPYVFNVADVFIFAGAIGLVFFGGERNGRKKAS